MSKDYAKRPRAKPAPTRTPSRGGKKPARRRVPGWLWVVTIAVTLAFIGGLHHISSRQPKPALGAGSLPAGHGQTAQTPRKVLPPPPEPQWTFHEVLAEKTVEIPDEPADKTKTANPASPPAPPKTYVLACGTFTGIDRAESLKAQLAMAGLHAQVKTITDAKHGTRYWVGVAPYTSKRAAQKDQHVARGAQIFSCIIL